MDWKAEQVVIALCLFSAMLLSSPLPLAAGLVLWGIGTLRRRRQARQLDALIMGLTHLQEEGGYKHLSDCQEGKLGVLSSEVYKLVDLLQEQAGAAQMGKRYMADMLADISHQLKTPLTALGILMDILGAPEVAQEKRLETVEKAETQLGKIQWLIRSLLVLSQLDAGVLALKREEVALGELLDGVCDSLEVLADVQDVTLRRDYGREFITLRCDREWTREALANIVKNCIEHSPGGTVTISALQHNFSTNLTIRDTGSGIPKEELPHIFERFYKGQGSSANSVGLGLALANQIVLRQNGLITAESQVGVGSVFSVRFYPAG